LTDEVKSAHLAALIAETEAAIAKADVEARKARERALDPILSPDPVKARAAMEDADFARDRLRNLLPRLRQRFVKVSAQEAYDAWGLEYDRVKPQVDGAAKELRDTYQQLAPQASRAAFAHREDRRRGSARQ
jgi:hypothetical protein